MPSGVHVWKTMSWPHKTLGSLELVKRAPQVRLLLMSSKWMKHVYANVMFLKMGKCNGLSTLVWNVEEIRKAYTWSNAIQTNPSLNGRAMAVCPLLHTRKKSGWLWQERRFVPGHCSTVMAQKPISKIWTVSSVTTSAIPRVVMVRILLLLAQCKGHWQAHNLWMVGGVTQKKLCWSQCRWWTDCHARARTTVEALVRWKRQVRSRWHCHQVCFARRMIRWTYDHSDGTSKNAIPLPLGAASWLLGIVHTYEKNPYFFWFLGNLGCLVRIGFYNGLWRGRQCVGVVTRSRAYRYCSM